MPPRPSPTAAAKLLLLFLGAGAAPSSPASPPSPAAGVTRQFRRPPPSRALGRAEVLRRAGPGRRLGGLGGSGGGSESSLPRELEVEQVHLGLGAPTEAVITFLSQKQGLSSRVLYKAAGGHSQTAEGTVTTYVSRMCPATEILREPLLGPDANGKASPVTLEELAQVVNTSMYAWAPQESAAYVNIAELAGAWGALSTQGVAYKNPLAYYQSPYIHTAVLTGLRPRTRYTYKPEASSRTFAFTTPPAPGDSGAMSVAVMADLGVTDVSHAVLKLVSSFGADVAVIVGDYSYADGWTPIWDTFGIMAEDFMSAVASLGVVGNHEIAEGNDQGMSWMHRYPQPFRYAGSETPLYWSRDVGLVHFVGLAGSYAPTDNGSAPAPKTNAGPGPRPSAQWAFLQRDLQRVNRKTTPWIVVLFHTPWYNSNHHHFEEGLKAQHDMEALLYEHGVDIVFNGHLHSYERSHPVYRDQLDPCGTVHIVIGDGGNYEGPAVPWRDPQPTWSALREASFGAGKLEVHDGTQATWRWHRAACVQVVEGVPRPYGDHYYEWNGSGSVSDCSTMNDNSAQRYEAFDAVTLTRDLSRCPNRGVGSGPGLPKGPPAERLLTAFFVAAAFAALFLVTNVSLLCMLCARRREAPYDTCSSDISSGEE